MRNRESDVASKTLHQDARDRVFVLVDEFAAALITQSKLLAYLEKAELVLTKHVEQATTMVFARRQQPWWLGITQTLGGALVGAFVAWFVSALNEKNTAQIAGSVAVGFVGVILGFVGTRRV